MAIRTGTGHVAAFPGVWSRISVLLEASCQSPCSCRPGAVCWRTSQALRGAIGRFRHYPLIGGRA